MKPPGKAKTTVRKTRKPPAVSLSPAALDWVAKVLGLSPREMRKLARMPKDQAPTPRSMAGVGTWAGDVLVKTANYFEGFGRQSTDAAAKAAWRKQAMEVDEALGIMMRNTTSTARWRALRSENMELLVWAVGDAIDAMKRLPSLFEQFARNAEPGEFDPEEPYTFPCRLVEALVELVKYLEDQSERHPERFRLLARELPHWPFLVTPHRAGYRKRFDHLAGKGLLGLGTECPLDTSPRAMYRLQTPVCGLLWEEVFQDWINVSAGVRAVRRAARERKQPVDAGKEREEIESAVEHGGDSDAERAIFRAAFALPDLSKATARDWANRFVIPYLHLKLGNWQEVPALAKLMGKKGGDTQAEKEIRRAVVAMARA